LLHKVINPRLAEEIFDKNAQNAQKTQRFSFQKDGAKEFSHFKKTLQVDCNLFLSAALKLIFNLQTLLT